MYVASQSPCDFAALYVCLGLEGGRGRIRYDKRTLRERASGGVDAVHHYETCGGWEVSCSSGSYGLSPILCRAFDL